MNAVLSLSSTEGFLMYTGADSDGNEGRPLLCATAKRKLTEIHKEAKKV